MDTAQTHKQQKRAMSYGQMVKTKLRCVLKNCSIIHREPKLAAFLRMWHKPIALIDQTQTNRLEAWLKHWITVVEVIAWSTNRTGL